MADMNIEYRCSSCGKPTRRSLLAVKKVLFTGMGKGAKTYQSRVVGWLCPPCVKKDEQYNMEPYRPVSEKIAIEKLQVNG